MATIPTVFENEDGWSDWQDDGRKVRLLCCDCFLAHDVEFKLEGKKILWRMHRNNVSTAAARRKPRKKVN